MMLTLPSAPGVYWLLPRSLRDLPFLLLLEGDGSCRLVGPMTDPTRLDWVCLAPSHYSRFTLGPAVALPAELLEDRARRLAEENDELRLQSQSMAIQPAAARLLTESEMCREMGVAPSWLQRLVKRGLPSEGGRFHPKEVAAWIQEMVLQGHFDLSKPARSAAKPKGRAMKSGHRSTGSRKK